jgi:hypothetical protein
MDMTTVSLRRRVGAGTLRLLWLVFLVSGLTAVSVVGVDRDPGTTNVPSVVLSVETRVAATEETRRADSDAGVRSDPRRWPSLRRRPPRCLGAGGGHQHRWHRRVRPIRGP